MNTEGRSSFCFSACEGSRKGNVIFSKPSGVLTWLSVIKALCFFSWTEMTLYKCATIYLSHNLSQIQLDFDKISGFLTDLLYFRRFEGEHWAEARRYDLALHKLLLQGTGGDRKCKWSLIWCWQPWNKNDKNAQHHKHPTCTGQASFTYNQQLVNRLTATFPVS